MIFTTQNYNNSPQPNPSILCCVQALLSTLELSIRNEQSPVRIKTDLSAPIKCTTKVEKGGITLVATIICSQQESLCPRLLAHKTYEINRRFKFCTYIVPAMQ